MEDDVISLGQVFRTLKKHLTMIIALTLGGIIIAAGVTYFVMTPKYQSSSMILVNQKTNDVAQQYNQVQTDLQMINTYKDIITKPVILDEAAKELNETGKFAGSAGDLEAALTISNNQNSQVVNVTAEADSPYVARDIVNVVTKVFQHKITKIMSNAKNVSIISTGKLNTNQVSPRALINLAVGALAGMVLGILLAFIRELTDKTVKDPAFITEVVGLPMLGMITEINPKDMRFGEARAARATRSQSNHEGGVR